jgi:hypothetical protein
MESTKYASVRVKIETYRDLKKAAIDEGIPFTRLIDNLLALYRKEKLAEDAYIPALKDEVLRDS